MAVGSNGCITNKCTSCNCSCKNTGGHSCTKCNVCKPSDDHTRKTD